MAARDEKVAELEKVIKTNENVINWLNKQIAPGPGPGPAPASGGVAAKKTGVGAKSGRGRPPLTTVQVWN